MEEKVALITGSAGGIGKACAEALLRKGAKVCLADVNAEAGKKTLEELSSKYDTASVIFTACDVTKKEDMERLFSETKETFGRIDIVCNNAGIQNETKWELMIDTNLKGVMHGTLLALQYMGKDSGGKGGVIVNVASILGVIPASYSPAYSATKHAVVGLTRSYGSASNFAHYGVRVNCLCPCSVEGTGMALNHKDQVLHFHRDNMLAMLRDTGNTRVTQETVGEVFLQLVGDESKNGETAVIKPSGTEFIQPPESLYNKLYST